MLTNVPVELTFANMLPQHHVGALPRLRAMASEQHPGWNLGRHWEGAPRLLKPLPRAAETQSTTGETGVGRGELEGQEATQRCHWDDAPQCPHPRIPRQRWKPRLLALWEELGRLL